MGLGEGIDDCDDDDEECLAKLKLITNG